MARTPDLCPECNTFIRSDWDDECGRCGSSLVDHPAIREQERQARRDERAAVLVGRAQTIALGAVAFVFVFAGVAGGAWFASGGDASSLHQRFGHSSPAAADAATPTPVFGSQK